MLAIEEILKKVRFIEIKTRKAVDEVLAGEYLSTFKGRGVEFSDVRLYQPGDDYRSIDWNVTSRTGEIHVKQFHEERQRTLLLVVDVSASLRFGTTGTLKSETLAELSALLAFSAVRSRDRVGLLLFSEGVELYIPPRQGREHVLRIVREVIYFEPRGRKTDFAHAFSAVNRLFPRRATVFLCSDFQAPLGRGLSVFAKRHDVTAVSVEDRAERELPKSGWIEWEDPESGRVGWSRTNSSRLRKRFREVEDRRLYSLKRTFRRAGVGAIFLDTGDDIVRPLVTYFHEKAGRNGR